MRVLLTGASGQLGTALTAAMPGEDLTSLGHNELDITDRDAVERAVESAQCDVVVNAAGYTRVDDAESDPEGARRVNVDGAENLALASARAGVPVLHISTDYIFDGEADTPYVESDEPAPRSVYGETKLAGEVAVREANPRHWIVRTAWLHGSGGASFPTKMLDLSRQHDEVRVVDDQRDSPTFAPDLAAAVRALLDTTSWGIWHLAGSGSATWYELTRKLYELAGVDTRVLPVTTDAFPRPAPRPRYSVLGTERDPALLLPPWEDGLARFVATLPRRSK